MFEEMIGKVGFWSTVGINSDVVLSTRIRLARNYPGIHFPGKMDSKEIAIIEAIAQQFVSESSFASVRFIDLSEIDLNDRRFLRERNIITYEMETSNCSSVILEDDEQFVIFINEEDHFRIQVIKPGFQIIDAFKFADNIDDELNNYVSYAFSDGLGYLTACPSNIGTGLSVSAMVYLPGLSLSQNISAVAGKIKKRGFSLQGTTGDDFKTIGNIYLVSNRITLGLSEVDLIEELDSITNNIIEMENNTRDSHVLKYRKKLEDKIWRAFGIMKYSRSISYIEAMKHLSDIRLGIILSIIKKIDLYKINDLMVSIQYSHLQKIASRIFENVADCDGFRAEYIREHI